MILLVSRLVLKESMSNAILFLTWEIKYSNESFNDLL